MRRGTKGGPLPAIRMMDDYAEVTYSPEGLKPEFLALLACGRAVLCESKDPMSRLDLPTEEHRRAFVCQAQRHGMAPIANRVLSTRAGPMRHLLHCEAAHSLAENLRQIRGLKAVAAAFERSGIPWLCIKGPVTASSLYDDSVLRPFCDIDVLIHLTDFERACSSLIDCGFRPVFNGTPEWHAHYFRNQSQITFVREGSRVDMHWELLPNRYSFAPAMNEVWARAECTSAFDVAVKTPGPNDTLVLFCLHAAKHNWERLIWLVDIAALVRRSHDLDWDALASDLDKTNRRLPLQVSFMLAQALFQVDLPARAYYLVDGNSILIELCRERMRRWQDESEAIATPWPWRSLYYRSMSSSADRRRQWHDVVFRPTPLEWESVPLPFRWRHLYYAIRPIRLIWKYLLRSKSQPQSTAQKVVHKLV